MLGRRQFLVGGAAFAALSLPKAAALTTDRVPISPLAFGARGDGKTDDTRAVHEALDHAIGNRLPLDGGSAVFGISANIVMRRRSDPWIRSLRLRQLAPANDRKSLCFSACERIRIDSLQVDVGTHADTGYMNDSAGLWVEGGSGHNIRNVEAFGSGKNSLIFILGTTGSTYSNLLARDARYDAPAARDDVLQGIFMLKNVDCTLDRPKVSRLSGNASPAFPNRFTRGIVLGGNVRVRIVDASVSDVDQGIDVTGSDGNRDCLIIRASCHRCTTAGVKLANSAVGCKVIDSVAEHCGLMGFFASGPSGPHLPFKTQDCDFIRCTAIDAGYNGFHDSTPSSGFRIERNEYDPDYPKGIRLLECRAIDQQPIKTMEYGFLDHVEPKADTAPNRLIDCRSEGHIRSATFGPWTLG